MMSREIEDGSQESEYEVEEICGKKLEGRKIFYLIKWVGYDEKSNTWEPEAHLNCPEKVREYEHRLAGLAHAPVQLHTSPPAKRQRVAANTASSKESTDVIVKEEPVEPPVESTEVARPSAQTACDQQRKKGKRAAKKAHKQPSTQAPPSCETKQPPKQKPRKNSKKAAQQNEQAATETTHVGEAVTGEHEQRGVAVGSDSEQQQQAHLRRQIQETEALLAMQRIRRQGSGTTHSLCFEGNSNTQGGVVVKTEAIEGTSQSVGDGAHATEQNVDLAAGSSGSSQSQNAYSQETRTQRGENGGGGRKEGEGGERLRAEGASAEGSGRVKGRFSIDHSYPAHKVPQGVQGVARYKGQLYLLVQWVNEQQMTFVPARHLNVQAPQLVIQYYESVLHFKD